MKKLLRARWVQKTLGVVLGLWMQLCYATMRITIVDRENADQAWKTGRGFIVPFWHAGISLTYPGWPKNTAQKPAGLISLSADAEFFSHTMHYLNVGTIRGSTSKRTRSGKMKDKGGSEAFRESLKWIADGGVLAITPDGPRGPAHSMAEGAVMLARLSESPVLMLGVASKPCLRLDSWDRLIVPLPFAHTVMVWGEPFVETSDDTDAERSVWKARLDKLTERAEALLA